MNICRKVCFNWSEQQQETLYLHCRNHTVDGAVGFSPKVIGVTCEGRENLREALQQNVVLNIKK